MDEDQKVYLIGLGASPLIGNRCKIHARASSPSYFAPPANQPDGLSPWAEEKVADAKKKLRYSKLIRKAGY